MVRETLADERHPPLRIDVMAFSELDTALFSLDQPVPAPADRSAHEWAFDGVALAGPDKGRRQRWTFHYSPF